jgi:hypothetical protein
MLLVGNNITKRVAFLSGIPATIPKSTNNQNQTKPSKLQVTTVDTTLVTKKRIDTFFTPSTARKTSVAREPLSSETEDVDEDLDEKAQEEVVRASEAVWAEAEAWIEAEVLCKIKVIRIIW